MKNMFVAIVFFFLVLVAWAKNDESDRSLPPVPPTVTTWTTVEEMPIASSRGQVKLASAPPSGLPDHLAIGSRKELREYIVGKDSPQSKTIWIGYGYTNTTGKYSQLKVGKWSNGYNSYEEFFSDMSQGIDVLGQKFLLETNYLAGSRVTASITLTYFNDSGVFTPFGLSLNRKHGNRESLETRTVCDSFRTFETNDFEQLIVAIPDLLQLELVVVVNGQTGTMTWNKAGGVKLASWPKTQAEPITTDMYFGMRGLCDGANRLRLTFVPKQGLPETYTQYGYRLSLPTILGMSSKRELQINAPKGADVDIWSSPDLKEWRFRGTVENLTSPISIPTLESDGPLHLYRAFTR